MGEGALLGIGKAGDDSGRLQTLTLTLTLTGASSSALTLTLTLTLTLALTLTLTPTPTLAPTLSRLRGVKLALFDISDLRSG